MAMEAHGSTSTEENEQTFTTRRTRRPLKTLPAGELEIEQKESRVQSDFVTTGQKLHGEQLDEFSLSKGRARSGCVADLSDSRAALSFAPGHRTDKSLRGRRTLPVLNLGYLQTPASTQGPSAEELSPLKTAYRSATVLGFGSFSTVHLAERCSDGQEVVLKQVRCDLDDEPRRVTKDEYDLLCSISYPAVIRALGWHETPRDVWICMEYCNKGSMKDYVEKNGAFDESGARPLVIHLLCAVNHLHQNRIVHRDIKPENWLLDDSSGSMQLKLADFNSAKKIGSHLEETMMLSHRGTKLYTAPEVYSGMWNERIDIWGCGLCVCFLLTRRLPFVVRNSEAERLLVLGELPPMDLSAVPGFLGNLVRQCLEPDPRDRPPAMELLAHPVFPRWGVGPSQAWDITRGEQALVLLLSASAPGVSMGLAAAADPKVLQSCGLLWRRQSWPPAGGMKLGTFALEVESEWKGPRADLGTDTDKRCWKPMAAAMDANQLSDNCPTSPTLSECSSQPASPCSSSTLEVLAARRYARMTGFKCSGLSHAFDDTSSSTSPRRLAPES